MLLFESGNIWNLSFILCGVCVTTSLRLKRRTSFDVMETYLKRIYEQKLLRSKLKTSDDTEDSFPFWDYRSRRGSFSISTSCSSSSGASSFDGCSLSSLSSIRSADSVSVNSSSLSSESDSIMVTSDPYRLQLQFLVDDHEVLPLKELYQSVVDWVDSDLRVFKVSERTETGNCNQSFSQPKRVSRMPSVAVMIFLSEEGPLGYERIQSAKRRFEKPPWKFHHSEQVGKGKINPYPFNSPDYFYTSEELPLWAIRLVHCGNESIRIVLFASDECWDDMLRFYKLIIGFEPDVNRKDFCMFTVHSREHYDVQFALKKLKGDTKPRALDSMKLQFRVPDVGSLVPLFPNVCKPISDSVWETHDHDGNMITIDVTGKLNPNASTPSDARVIPIRTYRQSSRSSRSSNQSSKSGNSVQSLTSVTSSSMTSSFTSLSSDQSSETSAITTRKDEDIPPKLPPRVPLNVRSSMLPEKPKECIATLQAFYV